MTGDFVADRAERLQARGHRPSRTADTRVREEKDIVVAGPGAATIGPRRLRHTHEVVASLQLSTDVCEVDSRLVGCPRPCRAR